MLHVSKKALLAGLLGGMICTAVANAQFSPGTEGDRVLFEADTVTRESTSSPVVAEGNVKAYFGERFLTSDKIIYDPATDIVTAVGNVSITDAEGQTFFANEVRLTGDLADGVASNFSAILADDSRLAAATVQKEGDERNILNRGVYTSCDVCEEDGSEKTPTWQVKALKVIQDKEDKVIRFQNAFVEVLGVPVLYTPYMHIPDPSVERQSGLLFPSFGSTRTMGAYLETPYYWAISDYQDATFSPKFMEDQGVLYQGEYRVMNWRGGAVVQAGIIDANEDSEFFISDRAKGNTPSIRYHFFGNGIQRYGDHWEASIDANIVSDKRYLRVYDVDRTGDLETGDDLFRPDRLGSTFKFERESETSLFAVEGLGYQSLRNNEDNDYVAQGLPRIRYTGFFDTPVIGGTTELSARSRTLLRKEGLNSNLTTLGADWDRQFTTRSGHRLRVFGELRGDIHTYRDVAAGNELCNPSLLNDTQFAECIATFPVPEDGTSTAVSRFLPTAGLEWAMPVAKQTSLATFIIEPRIQLIASPEASNLDDIINEDSQYFEFDTNTLFRENKSPGFDLWEDGQRANVGLSGTAIFNNGLTVEGMIGQQYRSEESSVYDAFGLDTGLGDTQSDIVGAVNVAFNNNISLENSFRLDKDDGTVRRAESTLDARYGRFVGSASYLKVEQPSTDVTDNVEEFINADLGFRLTKDWSLNAKITRDIDAGQNTRERYSLVYTDECARFIVSYNRDPRRDLGFDFDRSINFKIELLGITG